MRFAACTSARFAFGQSFRMPSTLECAAVAVSFAASNTVSPTRTPARASRPAW
jgi:hypothetical protein